MSQSTQGTTLHHSENLRILRQVQMQQLEDLQMLCTYAEYCIGVQTVGIDEDEATAFNENIRKVSVRQEQRYKELDLLITDSFRELRQQKTMDNTFHASSREVRKLESGLRTIRLFLADVVEMLSQKTMKENRATDRLGYFEKRSMELEAQMLLLQEKTTQL